MNTTLGTLEERSILVDYLESELAGMKAKIGLEERMIREIETNLERHPKNSKQIATRELHKARVIQRWLGDQLEELEAAEYGDAV